MTSESTMDIGLLLPDVLGTYGDGGNAEVLRRRLEWRGIAARVVAVTIDQPVPDSLDLYVLGGGEDAAQELAARHLARPPGLVAAAGRGAAILAVCAGLQLLGREFTVDGGQARAGLGLLDLATHPVADRAVGEIVTHPRVAGLDQPLTGFENHRGHTVLGPDAGPLATVAVGVGNGDGVEGAAQGRILGTYLHGPVLARNPQLADLLLGWAVGAPLAPLDLDCVTELRRQRLAAAGV